MLRPFSRTPQAPAADSTTKELLKPVPKPDENELKEKIEESNEKVAKLQVRACFSQLSRRSFFWRAARRSLTFIARCLSLAQARLASIKETLEARETGRGDSPEVSLAKAHLNEAKAKSRMLQQEKRNIFDQISAADDLKKQQEELTKRLKSQLTFFSQEQVDRKIKELEMQQQTQSFSVKEDKKIMEEIKRLTANKPMIKQYDEANESLKGVKDHHNTLYTQLKAKNADLAVVKEEEEKCKERMDKAKEKDDAKRSDIPSLYKERDDIKKEVNKHRDVVRKLRDDYNEKRKEWQSYTKQQKDIKHKEYLKQKAAQQAEYEARKKAYEEEMAKRDPWEEEKAICEQLISWTEKYLPKKEEVKDSGPEIDHGGKQPLKKADLDEGDPFAGLKKSKSKKKGGGMTGGASGAPATLAKQKSMKLSHSPEDFVMWEKLGFKAPIVSEDCLALHAQLLEKREWLKTAPPKKKKEEAKEEKKEKTKGENGASGGKKGGKGGKLAALTGELISVVATGDATVAVSIKL